MTASASPVDLVLQRGDWIAILISVCVILGIVIATLWRTLIPFKRIVEDNTKVISDSSKALAEHSSLLNGLIVKLDAEAEMNREHQKFLMEELLRRLPKKE